MGDKMKITVLFDHYKESKKKIAMLEAKLCYLNSSPIIKVSRYSDEVRSNGMGIEDRYHHLMEQKSKIENELWLENGKIFGIEAALDLLKEKNEFNYEILKLKYLDKKSLSYIGDIKGFSRSTILKKLRQVEKELETIIDLQAEM